ncbi:MAG: hypothetical protein A2010_12075 [Nitrospirae bacterium GWD2_57_9]|nr:MAG: hypothetical protein A2010_12075 [Nitrospirae bacterium GWD2_57_9]
MTEHAFHTIRLPVLLFAFVCLTAYTLEASAAPGDRVLFREEFRDLSNWKDFFFPKISRHSRYSIEQGEGTAFLKAESNNSASAIVYRESFPVQEYPLLRWRWKVANLYERGNARSKAGDDYPIRIYIMFEYDPEKAGPLERLKYGFVKKRYGEYPPHSSLSYVWASSQEEVKILSSPYTDQAKMVLLQSGPERIGAWQDQEVDIRADYREAFGTDPPARARIAIMNDSDDTGESSTSCIEYIEVFGR